MQNRQKILSAGLVVLFLALSGTAFWYYRYKKTSGDQPAVPLKPVERPIGPAASTSPAWEDYQLASKARKEKSPDLCRQLKVSSADICLYDLAVVANDQKFCVEIAGQEKRQQCDDFFRLAAIFKNGTIASCHELKSSIMADECYESFFWKMEDAKQCGQASVERQAECRDIVFRKMATADKDAASCDKISSETLKKDCKSTIESRPKDTDGDGLMDVDEISYGSDPFKKDTDGDGLSDSEELKKYFSDPRKADTDGDGHRDGEEVRGGFNPAGPGRLK